MVLSIFKVVWTYVDGTLSLTAAGLCRASVSSNFDSKIGSITYAGGVFWLGYWLTSSLLGTTLSLGDNVAKEMKLYFVEMEL